jgi:hypothetical protein
MKRNCGTFFLSFVLFLIIGQTVAFSQANVSESQSKTYLITLKDGSIMRGTIVSENPQEISLATENTGTVNIKKDQIKSMVQLDQSNLKKGKYWFPNPNYSRYFIGPGMQLKKGDGYYQNIDLLFNTVSFGLTNYFSIGGGVELTSALAGKPIIILMPKLGFKVTKSIWLGGGILYVNLKALNLSDDIIGGGGIGYGSATIGNENNNLSLGIGFGYVGSRWSDKPVITLSGMTRISPRFGLVTENWFVPNYLIFTYGVRFIGERMSVDIGLVNSKDIVKTFAIGAPAIFSFVFKF